MTATIAWLDYSEEDQRRAREILQYFTQPGSVDELGIGPVRDALSDAMFPGTSVLHTRARYVLFITWLFTRAALTKEPGAPVLNWIDHQERRLIEALRNGGAGGTGDGLIGRIAGASLKHLPSSIYWHALQEWGILRRAGTIQQIAGEPRRTATVEEALTEFVGRGDVIWDPTLPEPPDNFYLMKEASFDLLSTEAEWLAEKIEASVHGTLLAWLVTENATPTNESTAPWADPEMTAAPPAPKRVLSHAHLFSSVLHGAALLYNLLVAERCIKIGLDQIGEKATSDYTTRLETWAVSLEALGPALETWDLKDFWALVTSVNLRIPPQTQQFIDGWLEMVIPTKGRGIDNAVARQIVATREHHLKRDRSRLTNDRLLGEWTGSSGAEPLTYRWQQVKGLLTDISEGRTAGADA